MHRQALLAALCAAALLGACGSPQPRYYTLSATVAAAAPQAAQPVSVVVGPVSVRPVLDQPQIVLTTGPNQVSFNEFNRWATPLGDEVSRVVAQDLAATLGTPHVSVLRQSQRDDADFRVSLDIQALDSVPGELAALDAAWVVRRVRDGKSVAGRTTVRETPGGQGFDALAAAHSRAVGRMGQDIAAALRGLQDKR